MAEPASLISHPLARPTHPIGIVRLEWHLRTRADLATAWAAVSDTDAFNRRAGLGFRYEVRRSPDAPTRIVGRTRRLGLSLSWVEEPFAVSAPTFLRSHRAFLTGPASSVTVEIHLRPEAEGTAVSYSVEIVPRSALLAPLVALEAHAFTGPRLRRTLGAVLAELDAGPAASPWDPPPLPGPAGRRLSEMMSQLRPPGVGERLEAYIRNAPLREQDRILPVRLARDWGVNEAVVVRGMIQAVRAGALTLRWDAICPLCHGAAADAPSPDGLARDTHCTACDVRFDATWPDSLSVSFRTAPALRDFVVERECFHSPARQPHVLARDVLLPGHTRGFLLDLPPGGYLVRTWPPGPTASLEVHPEAPTLDAAATLTPQGFAPPRLRARPGQRVVGVTSHLAAPVHLLIERRWRPDDLLSLGRLLDLGVLGDVLPDRALTPGALTHTAREVVLAVAPAASVVLSDLAAELGRAGASRVAVGRRAVLALFHEVGPAVEEGLRLAEVPELRCGLTLGPVSVVTVAGAEIPAGEAVDAALRAADHAGEGHLALPAPLLHDAEVVSALDAAGMVLVRSPFDGPALCWAVAAEVAAMAPR